MVIPLPDTISGCVTGGTYLLVAVTLSGILKAKQKLGVTFNSNKLGVIQLSHMPPPNTSCTYFESVVS